ncbi:MAG: ketol-acid reductoisomerase [Candidatus Caldarchaeum sp.]|nr:ketol-acid reductoisomerase [Candidatus Caldarchaeum sp.]MDW8360559.1 ketol-acid reductoisomerase [Candidatus Caldarchaeum sp.]
MKVYYDSDISLDVLKNKKVAVIGYGSQGRAQALNMRDSGLNVVIGLRPGGASWRKAEEDGFEPLTVEEAAKQGDLVHILIPDMDQPMVYQKSIKPGLRTGKTLGFSHGYNIHFRQIVPPPDVDVVLMAPKSPGPRMRDLYLQGKGVPALVGVGQDYSGHALQTALAMAKACGCSRAGVIETTFKDETETDLFGEQAVLVGGVMELIRNGFEVLVENGYPAELAYFEVLNELKLIVDLIYQGGMVHMLKAVSDTAKYGGLTVGPLIVDSHVRKNMEKALERVKSGEFAETWTGNPRAYEILNDLMKKMAEHPIEKVGEKIRKMANI